MKNAKCKMQVNKNKLKFITLESLQFCTLNFAL